LKRSLDGAPGSDARARCAQTEGRASLALEAICWAPATLMLEAQRGRPIARPLGGGARRVEAGSRVIKGWAPREVSEPHMFFE
jgi:hypothetical protein